MSYKKGFTLAEVLITLGIVGVVAAMTIPTLINHYQHKVLETAFKKGYSELSQVIIQMLSEEGGNVPHTHNMSVSSRLTFRPMLQKYYKKLVDCSESIWKCGDVNFDVSTDFNIWARSTYKTFSKTNDFSRGYTYIDDGMLLTMDGMLIYIDNSNYPSFLVSIDTNGTKPPNAWGHDLFTFILDKDAARLLPVEDGICDADSHSVVNGLSCAKEALSDSEYFNKLP